MKELYSIMRDFLEIAYNQKSLLCLLEAAEDVYSGDNQIEAKLIANSTKYYLHALQKDIKVAINRMDSYITENSKK